MTMHTGETYDGKAAAYAARVDAKPTNALYERPAMLARMPPLAGLRVLDVGCGSGWYAATMTQAGASVTSFDLNAEFVSMTRRRLADHADAHVADLSKPLNFAGDAEFDLVVAPLVMHYLQDWRGPLGEFHRVLRPGGKLLFSTHHPFMDWREFMLPDYFATVEVEDEWDIGKVRFYHRPLQQIVADVSRAGFCIEELAEPQPLPDMAQADPVRHARMMTEPWFLVVRATKSREMG